MPAYTPRGIRQSAVRAHCSERVNDAGWPYVRRVPTLHRHGGGMPAYTVPPGASGSLLSERTAPRESTTRDGPTCGKRMYLYYCTVSTLASNVV
ncbi:Uncharacterized protein OBRU01_19137 [Operophtera brumata]|uniref:Uncharacterized protein n=1 Tax=Operophtera brumata TaxID=104452 RepID=A0A0L7KX92_OPEBR|nr:Uncharacterized protein OBRU01_19137 [Operophtera brumata]